MNMPDPLTPVEATVTVEVNVDDTPSAEPARELRPHPQLLRVWVWGTLVYIVPALLITLAVSAFSGRWAVVSIAATIGTLILTTAILHGRAWLARFRCRLLADGLWVHRGVWWRSEIFVPRSRVQHTEVQQGPVARRYGIASLKVYTAGSAHSEIEIDGLIHADALWLRDELLGRHGHDGV